MLSYCILFLCTLLVWASPVEKKTSKELGARIFNGYEAALGQFPWQAGVYYTITNGNTYFTSGSIISPEWVLTKQSTEGIIKSALIYTGQIELDGDVEFVSAGVEFLQHIVSGRAVILIKLGSPLPFNKNVKAIAIGEDELGAGIEVVVSGWGGNDGNLNTSNVLNYAYLNTISNAVCAVIFGDWYVEPDMVCTNYGTQSKAGPCWGDWGAPLVSNFHASPTLVGIIQSVPSNCQTNVDGVTGIFSRISYHRDWIRKQTGI